MVALSLIKRRHRTEPPGVTIGILQDMSKYEFRYSIINYHHGSEA